MYETFFQLSTNPFLLTPDPRFAVPTQSYREAFAGLIYALHGRKGFVALSAEPGTGKTTLLHAILRTLSEEKVRFSYLINPTLTRDEFLEAVLLDFGMERVPRSKAQRLRRLEQFLAESHSEGKTAVLVVDEAQRLTPELLEEIRFLTNFENAEAKLLQVVLAGQPELDTVLNRDDLRQLRQRIAVRLTLTTLSEAEVDFYIRRRWTTAGPAVPVPFSSSAIAAIARLSRGTPRTINVLCDNCLALAFSSGLRTVTPEHVAEVASDLQMNASVAAPTDLQPAPLTERMPFHSIRTLEGSVEPAKPPLLSRIAVRLGLRILPAVTD